MPQSGKSTVNVHCIIEEQCIKSYARERVERGNYPATSVQHVQRNINESIFSLWLFVNFPK